MKHCSIPVIGGPGNITVDGFTLFWEAVAGAQTYLLDLSTSPAFDTYLQGYEAKDIGNRTSLTFNGFEPALHINTGSTPLMQLGKPAVHQMLLR